MADKFELRSPFKFLQHIAQEIDEIATEWMINEVTEFFSVDDIVELTPDQIKEVFDYAEGESCPDQAYPGFQNIIQAWEEEHGELE